MKKSSYFFVLAAGALWGIIGVFVRSLGASLGSLDITFLRCALSLVFMSLFALVFSRKSFKIKIKDIWIFILSGVLSIAFFNFCYFTAIGNISLSLAAILLYTSPIFVTLFSLFIFKEKLTRNKIISISLAFLGCVLVVGFDIGGADVLYLFIGLCAGIGYALYSVFIKIAANHGYYSLTSIVYTFLFASLALVFFADFGKIASVFSSPSLLISLLGLVLLCTVIPYVLYTVGLSMGTPTACAVVACIEPVVASFIGLFVYCEKFSPVMITGTLLVLFSGIFINYGKEKENE